MNRRNSAMGSSSSQFEGSAPIEMSDESGHLVSEFVVPQMDCPSEEQMVRMALDEVEPRIVLKFDTPNRKLFVYHSGPISEIDRRLSPLGLGAALVATHQTDMEELENAEHLEQASNLREARILKLLLVINGLMFVIEILVGILAQSTGLIADSLDMFADAAVYGVALYAVGRSARMKVRAAHFAGWLQIILAIGVLSEVLRRFWFGSEPESTLMMSFGAVALVANVVCLALIAKNREGGAHMKASWIFSANDVVANIGVIAAGFLVALTGTNYPDLIIGMIIGAIVLTGGYRILKIKS